MKDQLIELLEKALSLLNEDNSKCEEYYDMITQFILTLTFEDTNIFRKE